MLCRVTHTAETLRTGDHSVPRIEAQIYDTSETTRRADLWQVLSSHVRWNIHAKHRSVVTSIVRLLIYTPDAQAP